MPSFLKGRQGTATLPGGISGKVTKWEATIEADKHSFGYDGCNGWKATVAGNRVVTGTVTLKLEGDVTPATVLSLDTVALTLSCGSLSLSGNAIVHSCKISCNIDTGEPVEASLDFTSDGDWS
jgi:hypothetical protein